MTNPELEVAPTRELNGAERDRTAKCFPTMHNGAFTIDPRCDSNVNKFL
jgi:hypothetical protein